MNPLQFQLVVQYLASGISVPQAVDVVQSTKELTGLAALGTITQATVCRYARYICALSLQKLSEILMTPTLWTFSIALDLSTHLGQSYIDIRLRVCWNGKLVNFHVVALPMFERHTGEAMFNILSKFLDNMCPVWRSIIVGVTTDGARNMTGRAHGNLQQASLSP